MFPVPWRAFTARLGRRFLDECFVGPHRAHARGDKLGGGNDARCFLMDVCKLGGGELITVIVSDENALPVDLNGRPLTYPCLVSVPRFLCELWGCGDECGGVHVVILGDVLHGLGCREAELRLDEVEGIIPAVLGEEIDFGAPVAVREYRPPAP